LVYAGDTFLIPKVKWKNIAYSFECVILFWLGLGMMITKKYLITLLVCWCAWSVQASFLMNPVYDATVKMAEPDTNFGLDANVRAQRDDYPAKGYVQFDASGSGVITNIASLKAISLYQYNRSAKFYLITGSGADDWHEETITWNNAPGNDTAAAINFLNDTNYTALLIGQNVAATSQYEQVALTWESEAARTAVMNELNTGDRKVTIGIVRNGDRLVQFASKENESYSPIQLELERVDHLSADTVLSDDDFFAMLDENYPGLEEVMDAYGQNDMAEAKHLLCEYYRSRGANFWWEEEYVVPNTADGEAALNTYQKILDQTGDFSSDHWLSSGEFDWTTTDNDFRRMYFFTNLGRAYRYSGNEEITQVWIDLFRAWIRQMPDDLNRLQMAIRIRSGWGDAFCSFIQSPALDDESLFLFMKHYYEQALYLRNNHSDTSNWLTFEMAGVYSSSVLFPEWSEADAWRPYVVDVVTNDLSRGWLPDGVTIELSPGYGTLFKNYLLISELANETGYGTGAVTNINDLTERLYEPYIGLMTPEGGTPAFNDGHSVDALELLQSATNLFSSRPDFIWAATGGLQGTAPAYLSKIFPYAGYAVVRSGWETNANYLCFDAGPVGYRHAHQDKLSLVMWAYGRQILADDGPEYDGTVYETYFRDTYSHSTGLVDNRPQRRKWYQNPNPEVSYPYSVAEGFRYDVSNETVWVSGVYTNSYGLAGGSVSNNSYPYDDGSNFYDGWGNPASHYRQVAYLQPDIFVVQDWFAPNDGVSHDYEIRWQLDSLSLATNGSCAETADSGVPNLAVVPLRADGLSVSAVSAVSSPDLMGWKMKNSNVLPATTLRHMRSGTGSQGFVTLLFPLKAGDSFDGISFSESDGVITLDAGGGRIFKITPAADPEEGHLQIALSPNSDQDQDGIPDWWEQAYFSGPTNAIGDALAANGKNTLLEAYIVGLNPNDPSARFEVAGQLQNGNMVLSWDPVTGRLYTVYWSTNLLEGFMETNVLENVGSYTGLIDDVSGFYKLNVRVAPWNCQKIYEKH